MPIVKKAKGDSKAVSGPAPRVAKARAETVNVSLPTKANLPPEKLTDYTVGIFGEKGIGKSSLAAQWPNAITFMAEQYRRNLPIIQVPDYNKKEPPLTWPRITAYVDQIIDSGKFKAVVFDTIDKVYKLCAYDYCKSVGLGDPRDINDFGKTWEQITLKFSATINQLQYAGITSVFLSHAKEKEIKTSLGPIDQVVPTCWNQAFLFMKEACDLAFYYGYRDRERVLHVRGNSYIWSACGIDDHFIHPKSKEPLESIPMGDSAKQAWKNLQLAWENKLEGYTAEDNQAFFGTEESEEEADE